jgi:peptidoglycan/xylan/chitin deacetylase (PgdA/CDA1 family)
MKLTTFDVPLGIPVLMFHGLCRDIPEYAVFADTRTCLIKQNEFSRIIGWIARNFQVIRLEDLDGNVCAGSSKRSPILITFDDALASVIDLACPILASHGISAVVFVTTEWTDSKKTPDIFLLEKFLWENAPVDVEIQIPDARLQLKISSKIDVADSLKKLWEFLFQAEFPPLNITDQNIIINNKPWNSKDVEEDRYFWFPATWDELRSSADAGVIEIGSHMMSHGPLKWLSDEKRTIELEGSKDKLSRMIGRPIISCSYPHGIIDGEIIELSSRIYKWGFNNQIGRLRRATNHNLIPRYHVPGELPSSIIDTLKWGYTISRIKSKVSTSMNW